MLPPPRPVVVSILICVLETMPQRVLAGYVAGAVSCVCMRGWYGGLGRSVSGEEANFVRGLSNRRVLPPALGGRSCRGCAA